MLNEDDYFAVTTTFLDEEVQVDVIDGFGLHQAFPALPRQWPVGATEMALHVRSTCITIEVMDEGGLTVW